VPFSSNDRDSGIPAKLKQTQYRKTIAMRGILILLAFAAALLFSTEGRSSTVSVTLGWNPSSSTAVNGYYIYYGTDTNINDMTPVPVMPATATNVTIGGLTSGQTYYFVAASFGTNYNTSALSPVISGVAGSVVAQAAGAMSALAGLPTGQFGFNLSGTAGAEYIVQASTNLVNWVTLQTNVAPFQFIDSNTAGFSRRFYRTVNVPN
jgi:hypothetical protein